MGTEPGFFSPGTGNYSFAPNNASAASRDLRLEQGDAGGELALRIGGQVLAGQLAGGVASRAWTRVIFH